MPEIAFITSFCTRLPLAARLAFAATIVAFGGCQHPDESVVARATPPDVKNERACTAAIRKTEGAIDAWSAAVGRSPSGPAFEAIRAAVACPAKDPGAWALAIESLQGAPEDLRGRWVVTYADAAATRAFAPRTRGPASDSEATEPNLLWAPGLHMLPASVMGYDYDGDGVAEALAVAKTVYVSAAGVEREVLRGQLWAFKGAQIVAYASASGLTGEGLLDIDGDGRPDLLTRGPYVATAKVACGAGDEYPVMGPLFAAHARVDGTFAASDAVAEAYARKSCPAAPSVFLVPDPKRTGFIDEAASATNVVCARVWGLPKVAIANAVAGACVAQGACVTCDDPGLLLRWGGLEPPVGLR